MKHTILIGFKHVGKTVIAEKLSENLNLPHVDLDNLIESLFLEQEGEDLNCRQIMISRGERFFRNLEHEALNQVLSLGQKHILSLGGGTPVDTRNQNLIKEHNVIHVSAPKGVVFERIMLGGRPAFFSDDGDDFDQFEKLWIEREVIFQSLSNTKVENSGLLSDVVEGVEFALNPLNI